MELLIGLHGESRSGKDTVAAFAVSDFGFVQRNMGDAIRNILLDLNPILRNNSGEFLSLQTLYQTCNGDWDLIKSMSFEAVEYMIRLGQSARDHLNNQIWLETVTKNIPSRLIIADVRQPNEYDKIKSLGGYVWKVSRPGTTPRGMDSLLKGYQFDSHIENRGTLEDLKGMVSANISSLVHGSYVQKTLF